MPVPHQCRELAAEIDALKQDIASYQADLRAAAPNQKPWLARQIGSLQAQVRALQPRLNACIAQHGGPPPPAPLESSFCGEARMTTTHFLARGSFTSAQCIGLSFNGARTEVSITVFPDIIVGPIQTDLGENTITVRRIGAGTGVVKNRAVTIPLKLRIDHSFDPFPLYEEDSDLTLILSTEEPPGSRLEPNGNISLAGSGFFQGGLLNGHEATMAITGTIAPAP